MTTPEGPRPIERGLRQEELSIAPEDFLTDNHSVEAKEKLGNWNETRLRAKLQANYRCSDARVKPAGINAISWASIAAADEPIREMASNRAINVSVALAHFDGDTVKPGVMPNGCGGLGVKASVGNRENQQGSARYVAEVVAHQDLFIQAWKTAEFVATISGKPALAAAQNHLTLQIHPLAFFIPNSQGEITSHSKVRIQDVFDNNYKPRNIYANGIPTIATSSLPDFFADVIVQNQRDMEEINRLYPDLRRMQKVQKPRMILFSTDIRPTRVKFPRLSSVPGSIFKVMVPRQKTEGDVQISTRSLEKSLDQLHYPISHANENYEDPTKPFSNTDRLIIETGSMDLSRRLAQIAMKEDWMRQWVSLPTEKRDKNPERANQIILLQTVGGVVSAAELFVPRI